jgi:hypothetical protein
MRLTMARRSTRRSGPSSKSHINVSKSSASAGNSSPNSRPDTDGQAVGSRYIYDLYYEKEAISKQLYDWLLKNGYGDANLIAKWKKQGYEKVCG